MKPHGTPARYTHGGCRCEACRAANTEHVREMRRRRQHRDLASVPHGLNGYGNYGCRCEECSAAHGRAMQEQALSRRQRADEIPHGTPSGNSGWGCKCPECKGAHAAAKAKLQGRTLRTARRYGYEWTGPDLEIAARSDLSAPEVAVMIGRTMYAVRTMRRRMKSEPRLQWLAGIGEDRT